MNNVLVHNCLSGDVYDGVELNSGEYLEPSQQQFLSNVEECGMKGS